MRRFVAIIGRRNAGKSTIIKSLTGCPTNSFRDFIKDNLSGRCLYVSCGSPQEQTGNLSSLEELHVVLTCALKQDKCRGIVMAIQPSTPHARLSMENILSEAKSAEFKVSAFVLDPQHNGATGSQAKVAQRLAPLRIVPRSIDGRRFAHINARYVNMHTKIID